MDPVNQARIDLAAALRWAARLGLHEGVCNHFSMAVPGTTDRFLINPQGLHWSEVTAGDVVMSDAQGKVIEGRHPVEPTAFFIHARIHIGKPSARVVLHTHMPYATALTTIQSGRLQMCTQNALRFHNRIAYNDDYNGLALDNSEGDRLCKAMGNADIAFLGNHGIIVSGPTMAMAFDELYFLERAAMVQVLAMSTGQPLSIVPGQIVEKTARQIAGESQQADYHFAALKRILDREQPGWSAL
jgi:ribulose-5-phosphate 4-epimerase/fuculose-1-phosphate aldolase